MTVVNHPARNQYTAIAAQTVFSYVFEIEAQENILVYKRAAGSTADDAADLLTLTTDYTVTGVGANNGGTVVLNVGATAGDIVTLQANAPAERDTTFSQGGVIQASNLNLEFDNDVLIYQSILATLNSLVPKYPKSAYVQSFDTILPQLAANQCWQMNSTHTAIIAETFWNAVQLASHDLPYGATLIGLHPAGTVQDLADAPFIVKTANVTTPNAQSLGALGSGILKNATGSGVLSISNSLTSLDSLSIAADKMAYGSGANTWSLTDLTAYSRTLLGQANSTGWLATLGAPSLAQAFLVSNNLSEGNAITKRFNLGLVIGTDVQAWDATLQSLSALGTAANKVAYTTGIDTWAEVTATPYSRGLWAGVDLAAWQVALGIPGGGGAYFAIANNLSEGVPATMRTNLGLVIGTDVQAYDATLQSLSALGTMSDKIAYTTGVDTWAETGITALGRNLIDDATQADMNTTIGSVPLAGGTMTGPLYLSGSPTVGSQAATKDYVDTVTRNYQLACVVAQTTDMPTWTYNNGALGVGATLTAPVNGATTFDTSIVPVNGDRILVLFQTTNPAWQGAYTIVQGTGGTPTVLTRATDWDTAAEMNAGDIFSVVSGTSYGATQWMFSQTAAITVGTTALTFTQVTGQGALLKANNLSDLVNVATARTNLGLVIGTNVQAQDATLQSISALGTAANKMIYTTGIDTWAEADITAFGRSLVDDADAATARTTLGLVIGTNVQAYNAALASIAGLTTVANNLIYSTASNTYAVIAPANSSVMISSAGGVPSWATDLPTAVTIGSGYIYRAGGTDVPVADGGTGISSTTAYGLIAGGTTTTNPLQNIGAGTVGQAVVSQGASALPTFASMYINRNVIPAGNFDTNPWQRGTTISISSGSPTYLADRFRFLNLVGTPGVVTYSRSADAPTVASCGMLVNNCLMIAVTTIDATIGAGDFYGVQTFVEGYDYALIAQRAMTLTFWHKHTKTGTYCIGLGNSGGDRYYVAEYTQAVSDTWEKTTINIAASPSAGTWDYTTGTGLRVNFTIACGSTYQGTANAWTAGAANATSNQVNGMDNTANRFRIALVQLEAGSIATPFEIRSRQEVLSHCQRYFWAAPIVANNMIGTGYAYTTSTVYIYIQHPVVMRGNPTLAISAVGDFTILYGNSAANVVTTMSLSNNTPMSGILSIAGTGSPMTANAGVMLYKSNTNGLFYISADY